MTSCFRFHASCKKTFTLISSQCHRAQGHPLIIGKHAGLENSILKIRAGRGGIDSCVKNRDSTKCDVPIIIPDCASRVTFFCRYSNFFLKLLSCYCVFASGMNVEYVSTGGGRDGPLKTLGFFVEQRK
eukprot:TRINITY_DN32855_c0_g1_i1.p1 TRINITY_DN32855_c0_g1~~TRINITY_DN32855_c0_g1_i1.p1  ORF type:complete len:128 (+),score=11.58 TRINITY_DN32855_c0_g1_i1:418-801(+)